MADALERLRASLSDRYRIERELGKGGMATVYLAADLKHDRKVAIKVLRPELAAVLGADRFIQEIKTTAALSHPHILPLFDSGEADGQLYYVMPYIEGVTIREKLDRETQFGIDEAVRTTREVADALDYAHRHGVIHRDIKPENILLHDGRPMVMDFGIALALSAAAGGRMTETGMSLGTPHYMSPEQATAEKEITARSDIYSLGSVLYEMLAGQPPHLGGSAQQVIMKIVTEEAVPVTRLRKSVPANVAAAVAKSLEKLPADRFESAKAFADALTNPAFSTVTAAATAAAPTSVRGWLRSPLSWAAMAVAAALALVVISRRPPSQAPPMLRQFYLTFPDSLQPIAETIDGGGGQTFELSRDAGVIVYVTGTADLPRLAVKRASEPDPVLLPGSDHAQRPTLSPDGRQVLFVRTPFYNGSLEVLPLGGGGPRTLVKDSVSAGAVWGGDGYVYYSRNGTILRVPEAGGDPDTLARPDSGGLFERPIAVPGRHVILFHDSGTPGVSTILAVDIPSRTRDTIGRGVAMTVLETGHLVLHGPRGTGALAVRFDLDRLKMVGEPEPLLPFPTSGVPVGFSVSGGSMVARVAETRPSWVYWVNRSGEARVIDSSWGTGTFFTPALSPDGTRLAISRGGALEVKLLDRGPAARIVSLTSGLVWRPAWRPDGRYIAYYRTSPGDSVLVRRADGVGEASVLASDPRGLGSAEWTPDGHWIVYRTSVEASATGADILAVRTEGDSTPVPLLSTRYNEMTPAVSPDGRWLAYASDQSGSYQVYVRPFPNTQGGQVQVSIRGGLQPRWAHSGKELYYVSGDGFLVSADVTTDASFAANRSERLFSLAPFMHGSQYIQEYDVARDNRRFVMIGSPTGPSRFVLIEGLQTLLPEAR